MVVVQGLVYRVQGLVYRVMPHINADLSGWCWSFLRQLAKCRLGLHSYLCVIYQLGVYIAFIFFVCLHRDYNYKWRI